jgi:site-specific recombinase XerD
MTLHLGQIVHAFFEDHLKVQRGLRPATIRSYRDVMRLFLCFLARDRKCAITKLSLQDLTVDRALGFLKHLEQSRGNHIRTRNQRRAALRTFFEYLASRAPEMLEDAQRVAAIPVKRVSPPETHYLEREEVRSLLQRVPPNGRHSLRNYVLLLFLYNTGARVQEVADLRVENLDLGPQLRVHLHGKGDKWRACPLWEETAAQLRKLLAEGGGCPAPAKPVFCSRRNNPLTRFGIYKIVRRLGATLDTSGAHPRRVTPHLFRHTSAVHLLESGVDVNVIRGWLGHVSLETTNRYAELTLRAKEAAMRQCEPHLGTSVGARRRGVWKDDQTLLNWLSSL